MMLWDLIRDFFVMYIFGGTTSANEFYGGTLGSISAIYEDGAVNGSMVSNSDFYILLPNTYNDNYGQLMPNYISIADWLSTTATIIVMVLLCFLLVKLAIWIFKLGANLIRLR